MVNVMRSDSDSIQLNLSVACDPSVDHDTYEIQFINGRNGVY